MQKVRINSEDISFETSLEKSKKKLAMSHPYLNSLNFNISTIKTPDLESVSLTYTVDDVTKTQGQTLYQDHALMFAVSNDYGLSVKSSSIYVVPKPRPFIKVAPQSDECTVECSSQEIHEFQCRIDTAAFANKELLVDHYWTINSHRLGPMRNAENPFSQYFRLDPITVNFISCIA